MFSLIPKKSWLKPKNNMLCKTPSRNIDPVCGPPRFPMSMAQKILIGGGSILLMMIIPIWGLLSIPSWSIKHQNLGKGRKEVELEGPPAE
ncbi:uncharacterized protein LOC119610164 [Lucilia sericata]|uniref:uncharacterized protein LOC119610164 n=1 Tax=Lucilia sericata TaxID=13632 RepID=UPI0018A85985|nr:uncharacterized protein LOC119610164 [Lucilia sericata]